MVNWNRAKWKLTNVEMQNTTVESVCKLPKPRHILFPELRTYEDHKLLCKTLNGNVTVIHNMEFQSLLIEEFRRVIPGLAAFYGVE